MWNESLIESSAQNNSKRWLTVQIAAIVHAAIVGVLVAGSFWYVDSVSLAPQEQIPPVFYEIIPSGGPPPAFGSRTQQQNAISESVKPVAAPIHPVYEKIVPETETIDHISGSKISNAFENNLPSGDPEGIPGGDPNSNSNGGFGGSEGNGLGPAPMRRYYLSPEHN